MRTFVSTMATFLAAPVLLGGPSAAFAQSSPPNILVIVTDDQRVQTLQVMPRTRALFARGGRRYTNAFAVTPLCCPSRATIFTGRYAHNTGVRSNTQASTLDTSTMFPRLLREADYKTALVGRFLNGWPIESAPPHFDQWARLAGRYHDSKANVNGSVRILSGYSTDLAGRYAVRFLRRFERSDTRPWMLYVATKAPHHPWKAADRHLRAPVRDWSGNPAVFERDRSDKPPYVRRMHYTLADGRFVRKGQLRTLMSVDEMVGRIFEELRALRESRNTLALYTSDNGLTWADHGIGEIKLIGAKRNPYSAAVKVPFLLRWGGHVPAGTRSGRLTGTVDIAPTILAAASVEPDAAGPPLDGRSLFAPSTRAVILLEHWRGHGFPTWASLRTRTFQYTEYFDRDAVTRTFREYYDLARDPWQLRNLLHDGNRENNPDVSALVAELAVARACIGTSGPQACP
jgi:arylsulfatase A-like enzyme